jgi:nitroreductase
MVDLFIKIDETVFMNIIDAIKSRRSIRKFHTKSIDRAIIEKIIEAGILAPSAKNRQPWKFIVVENEAKNEMIIKIREGLENMKSGGALSEEFRKYISGAENTVKIMEDAPVTIFVINTRNKMVLNQTVEKKFFELANLQSIGAAIENMVLAALEYGIGSLWINDIYFAYDELGKWLNTEQQIIAAISFGFPNENPSARPRKDTGLLVEWK